MLTICAWKWNRTDGSALFGPVYVNKLRAAFEKHLHLPHEVVCVTDDPAGIDPRVRIVPLPTRFANTPRCRRRMQIFSRDFAEQLGKRILSIDLDMVLVGDLTPIVDRPEPLVGWQVQHAKVFSGSFLLMDAGVLDPLWRKFEADPEGYPKTAGHGIGKHAPSDQAMLNAYLQKYWPFEVSGPVPHWTEADGFVTYYGKGYEDREHLGIGPNRTTLPKGARIVVLGSDDLAELEAGRDPWMREHWTSLESEVRA